MRISKPKGQTAEYKLYDTIALRDAARENLINGQDVKILDASGDPEIKSGWAIYKYDKGNDLFDLVEKEEQPEISESIKFSENVFAESLNDGILTALDATYSIPEGMRFMQDFDFDLVANQNGTKTINLYLRGTENNYLNVPVKINNETIKYLTIGEFYLSASSFDNVPEGNYIHWSLYCPLNDAPQTRSAGMYRSSDSDSGRANDVSQASIEDTNICIATIRAKKPIGLEDFKQEDLTVFRHWRKALVPAEERISVSEVPDTDEKTITTTSKMGGTHYIVPELFHPYQGDIKIMQDFEYKVNVNTDGKYMEFLPNGGTEPIAIPIQTPTGLRYAHIMYQKFSYSSISSNATTAYFHWGLSAIINDDPELSPAGMQYLNNSDGTPVIFNPSDNNKGNTLPIIQIKFKRPLYSSWKWYNRDIIVFKYWKQILAPAEERIIIPESTDGLIPDEVTLFETTLNEKQKIFAPALCQTHNANFRILEDFDFTYSVGKTYTGDKTFLRVAPIGGLRNIPVMDNGVLRYMSIAQESIIMPDLFSTNFVNQWQYFVLTATISDSNGTINPLGTEYETNGAAMFVTPYPNQNSFKFVQIGIKFNEDGETVDFQKNLKVFKYWKNALAPFNELIQNYNESNS